jgi:endonuclease/exonuclease/phosphatase family metal-dependent hydrolase
MGRILLNQGSLLAHCSPRGRQWLGVVSSCPQSALLAVIVIFGAAAFPACASRQAIRTAGSQPTARLCQGTQSAVTWNWNPNPTERATLDGWCDSVGTPVVVQATATAGSVRRLVIMSWNVRLGEGRVGDLVRLLRARTPAPAVGDIGVVLLLQEAFRGGGDIPATAPPHVDTPQRIVPPSPAADITAVAAENGLSLVYVPSMRNGEGASIYEREDRGNAILSTEPISDIEAIELPYGGERRVAVLATVTPRGGTRPVRVMTAHFGFLRSGARQADRLAEYLQTNLVGPPLVIGLDTNATLGAASGAVRSIERVVPRLTDCGSGRTSRWIARIDFMFSNLAPSSLTSCGTLTDRYGSDHVPLVLTVDL